MKNDIFDELFSTSSLSLFPSFLQTFNFSASYPNASCPNASCIFFKYDDEGLLLRNLFNLQIYNAVAFLWCVNFVIALGQCTLAGAFASYYWAFNKPADIPTFPVTGGFIRALRLVRERLWIVEDSGVNQKRCQLQAVLTAGH